jgi:hypothetical protein
MTANLLSMCAFYLCGAYGGQEWCIQGFGVERDHLEDLGMNGRIIQSGSSGSGMGRHGLECSSPG